LYLIGNTTTSQSVTLEQDHSYTLSGWVNKEAQLDISFGGVEFVISYAKWNSQDKIDITKEENAIYQSGNKIILKTNDGEWNYFEITFKPKVSAN
jgi:hypothetical protein